jgi:hypothetical protein
MQCQFHEDGSQVEIRRVLHPECGYRTNGMRNKLYLRSRTGVRASFLALTCAEGSESSSSRQTKGKLS